MTTSVPAPSRGRPPDPEIDERVLAATLELYAEVGWAGFTIDGVASRCHVGKGAIYRRWPSKAKLLTDALEMLGERSFVAQTGDLRADLIDFVERLISALAGPAGLVRLRAQLEARVFPEILGEAMEAGRARWIQVARDIVQGGIDSGQLPVGTSPSLVFDALRGTIVNHFLHVPPGGVKDFAAGRSALAARTVDFVLRGAGA